MQINSCGSNNPSFGNIYKFDVKNYDFIEKIRQLEYMQDVDSNGIQVFSDFTSFS